MDSTTHTIGSSTTTATSVANTSETNFNNLTSISGNTVNFEALWTDTTKPTVTITAKTNNPSATSQTATLKCSDGV
jgi:hypothetical protein